MTLTHASPSSAIRSLDRPPGPSRRGTIVLLAVLIAWATAVVSFAATGGFAADGNGLPWRVIVAVAAALGLFFAFFRRGPVRNYLLAIDPRVVLSIQLWRVVGAAFLYGWALDDLDASFAIPAGVGDVAVGVAAFVALAMLLNGTLSRVHVIALTTLGIGDFVIAVAVGGVIVQPDNLETLRWVLFPTLAVPFFAMAHAVTWTQLVNRQCEGRARHSQRPTGRGADGRRR